MNNRKWIFAGLIGLIFVFAGYNLYSYFGEQQVIQAERERVIQERQIERDRERTERAAIRAGEQAKLEADQQAQADLRAAEEAEREAQRAQERAEAEANARIAREAREQAEREQDQARLEARITQARTREQIEDFSPETINQIRTVSPRYLQANPDEALFVNVIPENGFVYPNGFGQRILLRDQTSFLMMAAAVSQNPDVLDTIIGLGADINAANAMGFTPLMFAAAYNTPTMVQYMLDQGADPLVQSLAGDANALHIAASMNPNPDVMNVLVSAGIPIESMILDGDTPLLLASEENDNLESVERLVELGADVSVSDEDGMTPLGLVTLRVENRGRRFSKISDEVNERVLQSLALGEPAQ